MQKRLLSRISEKMQRIGSLRPLPADAVKRLHEEMRLLHTYHSNAIEGNTLTLSETKLVLETGITIGGKALADHIEATNNARAFDLIEDLAKGGRAIDHVTIQEIHEVVTAGILTDSGRYRTHNMRIVGAKKTPPDWSKVVGLIDRLIDEIAESGTHPHHPHRPPPMLFVVDSYFGDAAYNIPPTRIVHLTRIRLRPLHFCITDLLRSIRSQMVMAGWHVSSQTCT
jgi:Fic family protein